MNEHTGYSYALNTSTIRNCGLDVPQSIEVTARAGYQGIELWVSEIEDYLQGGGTLADLRRLLDRHGLEAPNLIAFFHWAHPDEAARGAALDDAQRVLQMARDLGCPFVAAPPAGIADRDDISLVHIAGCYKDLLKLGRQTGTRPLLEFWGHSMVLRSLDDAVEVIELVDDPDAALLADVFHMAKGGSHLELLRELDRDRLGLVHINDYPDSLDVAQLTDQERVFPGDGVAPFDLIMGAIREIGYTGMLSLELFNEVYQAAGAIETAPTGLEKTKQVVEARR